MGNTFRKPDSRFAAIFKFIFFKAVYPFCYRVGAIRRVNTRKIIFVENRTATPDKSFMLLKNEWQSRGFSVCEACIDEMNSSLISLVLKSIAAIFQMSNSAVIFLCDSCRAAGCFKMRHKSQMIQIWHGCGAFKKWGFSTVGLPHSDSLETMQKYPYHKNYTLVPVSSANVIPNYANAFGINENSGIIKPLGVSRTDVFFKPEFLTAAQKNQILVDAHRSGKKIILYAPTFRNIESDAVAPCQMDIEYLEKRLSDKYILLLKYHPFVTQAPRIPVQAKSFAYDVSNLSTDELICIADICISDYSSLIFEFSLFERPMLFFAYDLEDYYDWRGFYFPYEEFVPGPIVRTNKELADAICDMDVKMLSACSKMFKEKFMRECDGQSTTRIVDAVQSKIK